MIYNDVSKDGNICCGLLDIIPSGSAYSGMKVHHLMGCELHMLRHVICIIIQSTYVQCSPELIHMTNAVIAIFAVIINNSNVR